MEDQPVEPWHWPLLDSFKMWGYGQTGTERVLPLAGSLPQNAAIAKAGAGQSQ